MTKRTGKPAPSPALQPAGVPLSGLRNWHLLTLGALLILFFFNEIVFRASFLWEDFLYQFYPFRTFASVAFAHGQIPLWNPYTFCGMPFAADITGTVFYLPHFLLLPWVSDGHLSVWCFEMFIILHFILAAVTMYACATSFGLSKMPAAFSALVYSLSGFMITHAIHTVVICQAAWFPLAVMLFKKTLDTRSPVSMILCGGVLSMIICGGHIQITLYFFVFLFAYFLLEMLHTARDPGNREAGSAIRTLVQNVLLAGGVMVIAVGLSAIQLLPTLELSGLSVREDFTFARSTEGELTWPQLITVMIPKFFGSSNALGRANPAPFWGPEAAWDFWETCIYAGIPALTLALFGASRFRKNRHVLFVSAFAVFALLFALGDNFIIHGFFYHYVPGFNRFRVMGRWGFFVNFAAAFLGGFGLQSLLGPETRDRIFPRILLVIAALPALLLLALKTGMLDSFILGQIRTGALHYDPPNGILAGVTGIAVTQTWTGIAVVLASCLMLLLLWRRILPPSLALILVFGVQFMDMYIFGFTQNNGKINPDTYFDEQRALVNRLKEDGKKEYFRVNGRNGGAILIDRNQGLMDRIFLTDGYTQLALQRWLPPAPNLDVAYRLMNTKYRTYLDTVQVQRQRRVQFRFDADTTYLPRAFFVYRYRVLPSPEQESAWMADTTFNPRTSAALEEEPGAALADPAAGTSWNASIDSYSPNGISLSVSTPTRGMLVLSEIHYPGWNAYVDGTRTPVYRADWCLRAIVVDAGKHVVQFRYEPMSFRAGVAISFSTLGLCIAGLAFTRWRRRRTNAPPEEPR